MQHDSENHGRGDGGANGPALKAGAATAIASAVAAELQAALAVPPAPGLWLVATPIGHLADVGLRALAVIAGADDLYCEDVRHSRILLSRYAISRPARPYHEHNGERERPRILAALRDGRSVAIISDAGTPLVSDPGYKLVREAIEAGIPVHAVPGPSAVLCALAVSGLPTDSFFFAGFLPARDGGRSARLAELKTIPATLVLFEAPGRLARTLETAATVLGGRTAAVGRELTKRFEEVRRGSLAELAAWAASADIKGEIVIVIGPPEASAIGDDDILAALREALPLMSVRDAAQAVADRLGAPKAAVYDLALRLKREDAT